MEERACSFFKVTSSHHWGRIILVMRVNRIFSIDIFRGIAIVAMVMANFMTGIQTLPAWLKHAPDVGLTVIDFIAPFFVFAIGLTYRASFERRLEKDGALKAYS
jgi:predicted acyltransferase